MRLSEEIEFFYNKRRLQSSLGYKALEEFDNESWSIKAASQFSGCLVKMGQGIVWIYYSHILIYFDQLENNTSMQQKSILKELSQNV